MSNSKDDKRLKVLVVDDEPIITDTLVQILKRSGFEAVPAYNPDEAIRKAANDSFDILLSDVIMPEYITGIDLAIEFKRMFPECKVLLMSGNNSSGELLQLSQQLGHWFEILAKPVPPAEIIKRLNEMSSQ